MLTCLEPLLKVVIFKYIFTYEYKHKYKYKNSLTLLSWGQSFLGNAGNMFSKYATSSMQAPLCSLHRHLAALQKGFTCPWFIYLSVYTVCFSLFPPHWSDIP